MTDIAEQHWRERCHDLQAEVTALEAENERLREALLEIDRNCCGVPGGFSGKILDVARAALEGKP